MGERDPCGEPLPPKIRYLTCPITLCQTPPQNVNHFHAPWSTVAPGYPGWPFLRISPDTTEYPE